MHIKEIIVDGFKSYAHKTTIVGFDPHFNAITGLNGSGKSNILDSICFVLGITNLSHVRAGNLSELVYKQGQAGISKATVTIVFHNEDPTSSPVGYETCPEVTVSRQVLIGGKSKYLINGKVSPANQVQNLFHSVQLNVNNPHFLIMQGRITKVLNMKPQEILGMVEEAAGTRMYETKKLAAIKTIDKKEAKVAEINTILGEEITPTLERLRGEKQNFLNYQSITRELESMGRKVIAGEYMNAQRILDQNQGKISDMEAEAQQYQSVVDKCKEELSEKEEEIERLSSQLHGEFGQDHKDAKQAEESLSKDLVRITTQYQHSQKKAESAKDDVEAAKFLVQESKEAVQVKQASMGSEQQQILKAQQEAEEAELLLQKLSKEHQNMCAGLAASEESSEDGDGLTLPDQISKAHSDANQADAKVKQGSMKMKHLDKELKTVERDLKKEEKSCKQLTARKEKAEAKVNTIQSKLSQMNFSPTEFTSLETQKVELEDSISNLQEVVDTLTAQLRGRLSFQYSDPVKGFDRSKVKGLIAKLIHVQNPNHTTALEVVAGGKLYQVVVDDAITGKALLSRGKLQRRVTIIPLDKIASKRINANAIAKAKEMASDMGANASPAIELVGYEEDVRNAIEYVFGSSIVVDNVDAANKICDATRTRTVTLEGDVYDPSGTISGGSKNNLGTTLVRLTELTNATTSLQQQEQTLRQVRSKLSNMKSVAKQHEEYSNQLEIAQAELSSVEKHVSQTKYGLLHDQFTKMTKEREDARLEVEEMTTEKERKWDLYQELKDKEEELTKNREKVLKDVGEKLEQAKLRHAETSKYALEAESQSQTIELELESLRAEVAASEEAISAAERVYNEAKRICNDLEIEVGNVKEKYDHAKHDLDEVLKKMSSCSEDLQTLNNEKAAINKKSGEAGLEAKKITVNLSKYEKEIKIAEKMIESLTKKHRWIPDEKDHFGIRGGDYDIDARDAAEMSSRMKSLQEESSVLEKKINKKVMGMIEKAEGEYAELLRKRKVVENDKKKIQSVITELDVKKKSELERTWIKVNRDFGSIFSTLLQGASAKLEPPEGMEAWEGLEVKVAFGNVWKKSLSELSGGQRSLLALSLILSLLLFKPAPMYILDEVDAALDLSHTQNIGSMLKTHFSQSQFIVVSLKEGMFNNANVIYRTKFVDGISTVTRTLGVGASSRARALAETGNNLDKSRSRDVSNRRKRRLATGKEN